MKLFRFTLFTSSLWLAAAAAAVTPNTGTLSANQDPPTPEITFPCDPDRDGNVHIPILVTLIDTFGAENCDWVRDDHDTGQAYWLRCGVGTPGTNEYAASAEYLYDFDASHITVTEAPEGSFSEVVSREVWTFGTIIRVSTDDDYGHYYTTPRSRYHNFPDNESVSDACFDNMRYLKRIKSRIGRVGEFTPGDPLPCNPQESPWNILLTLFMVYGRENCGFHEDWGNFECKVEEKNSDGDVENSWYATYSFQVEPYRSSLFVEETAYHHEEGGDYERGYENFDWGHGCDGAYEWDAWGRIMRRNTRTGERWDFDEEGLCINDLKHLKQTYGTLRGFSTPSPTGSPSGTPTIAPTGSIAPSDAPSGSPSGSPTMGPNYCPETHETIVNLLHETFGEWNCYAEEQDVEPRRDVLTCIYASGEYYADVSYYYHPYHRGAAGITPHHLSIIRVDPSGYKGEGLTFWTGEHQDFETGDISVGGCLDDVTLLGSIGDQIDPTRPPTVSPAPTVSAPPSVSPSTSAYPSDTPSVSAYPSVTPTISAVPSSAPSGEPSESPTAGPTDSSRPTDSLAPSDAPTRDSCGNTDGAFPRGNGDTAYCADIAMLADGRKEACTGVYQEHCPGLCKTACDGKRDYEYGFTAKATSTNVLTCEAVSGMEAEEQSDKCRFKRVYKNCPRSCYKKGVGMKESENNGAPDRRRTRKRR